MDVQEIVATAADLVVQVSARLVSLQAEIRAAQPVGDGAVLLELYRHKPPCLGCPHVIWKQWRGHPHHPTRAWQAHRISDPLRRLPRCEEAAGLRPLVVEALALERQRAVLVKHFSAIARAVGAAKKGRQ